MGLGPLHRERGMSLMEVTMAVAIFSAVIAVTAQALVSFYMSIDIQKQRIEAVNSCKAVLAIMREKRDELKADFPQSFLAWVQEQENDNWQDFLKTDNPGTRLREHKITADCFNLDGAEASNTDNPIRVDVTSTWLDRRGRAMQAHLTTLLTNE